MLWNNWNLEEMQLEIPGPPVPDFQNIASSSNIFPDENKGETQKIGEPLS